MADLKKISSRLMLGVLLSASLSAGTVYAQEEQANVEETEEIETFTLDPIVVTATRVWQNRMDVPADITVLRPKDWESRGAITLADALEGAPGINMRYYNGRSGVAVPYINGTDQVVVLVDGVRLNKAQGIGSGTGGVDLNEYAIDSNAIDRIEIVRGGGSSLYGADAVGGVIQIFTKKGDKKPISFVGLAFGNDGQQKYRIGTSGGQDKISWRVNGSFYTTDGYRDNDHSRSTDLSLRLDRETNGGNLFFTYDYNRKKAGYPGPLNFLSLTDNGKVIHNNFNLGYTKNNMIVQLYHNKRDKIINQFLIDSKHKEATTGILYQDSRQLGDKNLLTWGIDLKEAKIDSTDYADDKKRKTQAYFLQDTFKIGEKFTLTPGIRYEKNSDFGDKWLPKIGAIYKAKSDLSFFANWGKVFRAPSFDDLYWNDPWMPGNPNLKPETGWTFELGAKKLFGKNHEASISFFKRQMKDKITWAPNGMLWMPMNVEDYTTQGVTIAWSGRFSKVLRMNASYTYFDTNASTPILEPRNQFNIGFHYEKDKFSQSLNIDVLSKMDQVAINQVGGHAVINTSTQYKIAKDQKIYLNIYNLLDKDYAFRRHYPANGISFLLGWDMTF